MTKVLFWLAVIAALFLAARLAAHLKLRTDALKRERDALKAAQAAAMRRQQQDLRKQEAVTMVSCAYCAVHLPRTDALWDQAGRPYCSTEHASLGPRQPSG